MNETGLSKITGYYDFVFTDLADPRTNSWFLITDPLLPLSILILYWYFIFNLGPRWMKDRKPYELRSALFVFNFIQVLANTWLFIEAGDVAWFGSYDWRCEPVDFSYNPRAIRVARACYIYFIIKLTELLDTVFFVLRKKDKQITFLHVYHHSIMAVAGWGCTKYYPGGSGTFVGLVNCLVHIIMYTYYLLAALGPEWQKFLWWKKYITTMQLGQFCLFFIHFSQLFFYDCGFPRWPAYVVLPNVVFFYYLFTDFYQKAYGSTKAALKTTETCGILPSETTQAKKGN